MHATQAAYALLEIPCPLAPALVTAPRHEPPANADLDIDNAFLELLDEARC